MNGTRQIVFVCLHGAAKSVLAAADFQRLANERGLRVRAVCAGLEPDPEISPAVVKALAGDGVDLSAERPRRLRAADLHGAWRVISFGCDVGDGAPASLVVERWDEVPAVGAGLEAARTAIRARLGRLLDECERADG